MSAQIYFIACIVTTFHSPTRIKRVGGSTNAERATTCTYIPRIMNNLVKFENRRNIGACSIVEHKNEGYPRF